MYRYLILISLFLSLHLIGWAQSPSYSIKIRTLSIEDGLSNRFVRRVFQDSKGFIWLATNYGLNRYYGYDFKLFTKENQNLSNNAIYNIFEDSDSCLWVTFLDARGNHLNQVDIVNLNTNEITPMDSLYGDKMPFSQREIFDVFQIATQEILIVTKDKHVYAYQKGGSSKQLFKLPYPTHTISKIIASDEYIWVFCYGVLLEYNRAGKLLQKQKIPFKSILDVSIRDSNTLQGFAKTMEDGLISFSKKEGGVIQADSNYQDLPAKKQKLNSFNRIKIADNGLVWISGKKFASVFDKQGKLVADFSNHIPSDNIYSVYYDRNNTAWVATTMGVYVATTTSSIFRQYLNSSAFLPDSETHSIRAMVEDNQGALYINTYSGRYRMNAEKNKLEKIEGEAELDAIRDHKGLLWFCGETDNVESYNPQTGQLNKYPSKVVGKTATVDVRPLNVALLEDKNHRIWMGTNDGIYYFDTLHQAFIKFSIYGACQKLNTTIVYDLYEDVSNGVIWIATSSGVFKYEHETGAFTKHYHQDAEGSLYLPHDFILYIHPDEEDENIFWLGTKGGGLIKWQPYATENNVLANYTVASGLSDNVIYAVLEDNFGHLWMSSNYGLMRFDKATAQVKTYLPKNGITHQEFNVLSHYEDADGHFYFGGLNGFVSFDPKVVESTTRSDIPLYITDYQQMNGSLGEVEDRTQQLLSTGKITLAPNDNFFRITVALLDYHSPQKNSYAYKIEGINTEWQFTKDNVIRFHQIPAGEYLLQIKGKGADGKWSRQRIEIPIKVEVPFFKTYLFMLLVLGIIGLLFFLYFRMRMFWVRKNRERLENEISKRTKELRIAKDEAVKSSQAKAEFLSIMSHEIRTPMNAVVNITNFLLEDQPTKHQVANLNILKFSADNLLAIINDVLDFNKIESGKVTFEKIEFNLHRLIDSIRYSMKINAENKNITFETDCQIPLKHLLIGDPSRLTQVLNNLVSNAIKFTEEGQVKLATRIVNETASTITILFSIEDTGIGIAADKQEYIFDMFTQASSDTTRKFGGTGLGLAICQKLIRLQNSEIKLESTLGEGATFFFELTFGKGQSLETKRILGAPHEAENSVLKNAQILVVEDNQVNVMVVKKFLQKWDAVITHANDGEEAVDLVKKNRYDIILMDIHMPNMDGYEATRVIRSLEDPYYTNVPIIALTASALMDDKDRVYQCGMNAIVVKPFVPADLYKTLRNYLTKNIQS